MSLKNTLPPLASETRSYIRVQGLSKSYEGRNIIDAFSHTFYANSVYVFRGKNGVGKSTLLKMIATLSECDQGEIHYQKNGQAIQNTEIYREVSFCAPYIPLPSEMKVEELLGWLAAMKAWKSTLSLHALLTLMGLYEVRTQQVKNLSSGLTQRLHLLQALCADTLLCVLDEPSTALDETGMEAYRELLNLQREGRIILMASHREKEYNFISPEEAVHCITVQDRAIK